MENKLVVVIMGQDCEKFIEMALESVKDADAIVYCDGGSNDNSINICKKDYGFKICYDNYIAMKFGRSIIQNKYNQEDKGMNGKQRNFYLEYVKKNYPNWWCLAIDADEIVDDFSKIKEFIQLAAKDKLYSVKMRHLIGDLGHEDATQPIHFVPHRLFHIGKDLYYTEVEHSILQGKDRETLGMQTTCIWHLSYISGMWDIKNKYENHLKKSQMHIKEYLDDWKDAHMLGLYPRKQIDIQEIPDIILKEFGVSKEKWYFRNRGLETKHFIMLKQWIDYFEIGEKKC